MITTTIISEEKKVTLNYITTSGPVKIADKWRCSIHGELVDKDGKVEAIQVVYGEANKETGEKDFNEFWKSYTSGGFLLSELMEKAGIKEELPKNVEDLFINK